MDKLFCPLSQKEIVKTPNVSCLQRSEDHGKVSKWTWYKTTKIRLVVQLGIAALQTTSKCSELFLLFLWVDQASLVHRVLARVLSWLKHAKWPHSHPSWELSWGFWPMSLRVFLYEASSCHSSQHGSWF